MIEQDETFCVTRAWANKIVTGGAESRFRFKTTNGKALAERGYAILYRPPQICPGCHGSAWMVGRQSAECAHCGTALPLASAGAGMAGE